MIQRALISVSDKSGIVELAKELTDLNIELISTGGTFNKIKEANIPIISVEEYTGAKEILGGRVKTLNPKIHGGILAQRSVSSHMSQLTEHGMKQIDLVIVNLYPFKEVIQKKEASPEEVIENIDIGGVALLRAAAKNYKDVVVITDPADYELIVSELKANGSVSLKLRFELALKAFQMTSDYDTTIFSYLNDNKSQFVQI